MADKEQIFQVACGEKARDKAFVGLARVQEIDVVAIGCTPVFVKVLLMESLVTKESRQDS